MKLYILTLLKIPSGSGSDYYDEKIVRASSPREARLLANENTADEGKVWIDPKHVKCELLTREGRAEVIMMSGYFHG